MVAISSSLTTETPRPRTFSKLSPRRDKYCEPKLLLLLSEWNYQNYQYDLPEPKSIQGGFLCSPTERDDYSSSSGVNPDVRFYIFTYGNSITG